MHGTWSWYRTDGSIMRTGGFDDWPIRPSGKRLTRRGVARGRRG
jgi:hypothetical protein